MRRTPSIIILLIAITVFVAACGGPKSQAKEFSKRMPERVGLFTLNEDKTLELSAESVGSTGHVTLTYEARNLAEVYIVIDVYGTESAADVAESRRERDLRLMGAVFETDRQPRYKEYPAAQISNLPGGRVAIFRKDQIVIEVQYIPATLGSAIADTNWLPFLEAVRNAGESLR
ncbi:MAG: hypothetical protein HY862_06340 [Chloroflexi bacterium]|nr:hypothetical protein [Chloroflexota bacterium]